MRITGVLAAKPCAEPVELVRTLLARTRIPQHTPEWHGVRQKMITASNAASILGVRGAHCSKSMLMRRKTGVFDPLADQNRETDSAAMAHGRKFEAEAGRVFAELTGHKLVNEDIGLLTHPTYTWLGASPDFVTYSGELVETKCPYSRVIVDGEVPAHYMPQVQLQLEICDAPRCYFVQYKPPTAMFHGQMDVTVVERDPAWMANALPKLLDFWNQVEAFYARVGKPIGEHVAEADEIRAELCPLIGSGGKKRPPSPLSDDNITPTKSPKTYDAPMFVKT